MAKKAANPTITIKGKGTMPIIAKGTVRRVPRGKAIKVSDAERAFLDHAGVAYS